MSAIGTALGPSLGGVLVDALGWQAPFLVLAVAGAIVSIPALRLPRAATNTRPTTGLDLPGALMLSITLTACALAMTGPDNPFSMTRGLLVLLAVTGAGAFVLIERRSAAPVVDLAVFRDLAISRSLFMNLLVSAGMMATLVVGPFYLTYAFDLNGVFVGLVMSVGPATAALAGIPAGWITDRYGSSRTLVIGLSEMIAGFLCLAFLPGFLGVPGYLLSLVLLTPGFQLFLAANNTAVMLSAPGDRRGMISGMLGLSRNLGFMAGTAVMGALFAAVAGTPEIALASPRQVSIAFTVTFVTAAGLMMVALAAAVGRRQTVPTTAGAEIRR